MKGKQKTLSNADCPQASIQRLFAPLRCLTRPQAVSVYFSCLLSATIALVPSSEIGRTVIPPVGVGIISSIGVRIISSVVPPIVSTSIGSSTIFRNRTDGNTPRRSRDNILDRRKDNILRSTPHSKHVDRLDDKPDERADGSTGRQHATLLRPAPQSVATIEARRAPQPIAQHHRQSQAY